MQGWPQALLSLTGTELRIRQLAHGDRPVLWRQSQGGQWSSFGTAAALPGTHDSVTAPSGDRVFRNGAVDWPQAWGESRGRESQLSLLWTGMDDVKHAAHCSDPLSTSRVGLGHSTHVTRLSLCVECCSLESGLASGPRPAVSWLVSDLNMDILVTRYFFL